MAVRARTLLVRFVGDSNQVINEIGKIDSKTSTLTKLERAGKAAFMALAAGGAVAAAGVGYSIKSFMDFDAALNQSIAIMGDVSDTMRGKMADAARAVALETTFSAKESAEAFYGLASAGLSAEQSIAALPLVAKFAQAGLLEMSAATDYLTTSQAALGLVSEDAAVNLENLTRVADVLTEVNNIAQGRVEDFAAALTNKAATAMHTMNIELEEGVAVLGAFAKKGVIGQVAGEKLAIFLRDTARAAVRNKDAFAELGIEIFDQSGNLKNLADVVFEFEDALGGMSDAEKAAALEASGMTRSVGDIIRTLMGSSGTIREFEAALREAGGTTEEVASKQMQTFSAQVELLKNRITDMAIEIGSRLVPAIEPAVVWLQENLPTAFETAETVWREEVKPILEDIGKIIEDPVIPALKDLWEWFDKNEWAATGLAKAITAVTVALAALYVKMKVVTAIKGLFSVFTPLAKVVGYAGAIILTVIGVIWTSLNHLILGPFTLFIGLWAVLIMVVQRFSWIFVGAWNVVYEVFSTVMGFIFDHWRIFLTILTGGLFLFVAIFIAQWTHIREFFGGILGWMWDRVNDFWHLLQGAWNVITIAGVAVWHAIRWAAQHAWDWIMQRTEGIRSWLGDTAAWIGDRFSDAWEFIRWYAGQVWDWITEKIGGVVDWIKRQVDRIKGFVGEVGDALSSIPGAGVVKSGINFVFGSTGGIVPQYLAGGGMSRGMDTVPAMLTPGEMVLNAQQQRHLFNLIHTGDGTGVGSGGNTYVVINNPVISTEAQFENMVVNAIRSAGRKGTPITIRGRRL